MNIKRQPKPRVIVVFEDDRFGDIVEEASNEYDPYEVLQRKIEALMEITGSTEAEAERMILQML